MVTITRIVLMPIPGYLLYGGSSELFAALLMIIVLGLTDWLDGIMARREGPSVLGGLLDPIADKIFIAVIYLPLTDQGAIPIVFTAFIFARDFIVTALRTSLSLRDAPMRTSKLAKYKTAIQMVGIGYVILYLSYENAPNAPMVWLFIVGPITFPVGLILYRLIKGQKQGQRSFTMMTLMIFAVGMKQFLGLHLAIMASLVIITAMTVISGFSYIVDAWSAFRGERHLREIFHFILDGILVPVLFVLLLGAYDSRLMSVAVILVVTLELAVGGLGNLLASEKKTRTFGASSARSIAQTLLAAAALVLARLAGDTFLIAGQICIGSALAITVLYCAISFWRHRRSYLSAI
jgi:cardiolipin synthase (CMP-forming)